MRRSITGETMQHRLCFAAAVAGSLSATLAFAAAAPAAKPAPAAAPNAAKPAQAAAPAPALSDKAQIERLERRYIAAFNAKDVKAIMSFYAPGAGLFVFDVTPPRQHVGWADYKKDYEDLFAAFPGPWKVEMSDLNVTTAGDVAYGHNIQATDATKPDGSKLAVTVRVTDVYRKVNGKWLIVQEHVSVPVDLTTMKPDLTSAPSPAAH
jgi:ketosteroid isomerase-like protein